MCVSELERGSEGMGKKVLSFDHRESKGNYAGGDHTHLRNSH